VKIGERNQIWGPLKESNVCNTNGKDDWEILMDEEYEPSAKDHLEIQ